MRSTDNDRYGPCVADDRDMGPHGCTLYDEPELNDAKPNEAEPSPVDTPLGRAFAERRSTRQGGPVSPEQVAELLRLAGSNPPSPGGFRTIYPVAAFEWHEGELERREADLALSRASGALQGPVPPAVVLLRAKWGPLRDKYGPGAVSLAVRETGVWMAYLGLACVELGLGGCCLGPAAWGEEDLGAFAVFGPVDKEKPRLT